jgi:hypothetical protein
MINNQLHEVDDSSFLQLVIHSSLNGYLIGGNFGHTIFWHGLKFTMAHTRSQYEKLVWALEIIVANNTNRTI